MSISDKVDAVNLLVIAIKYPMERLTHHNETIVTVDSMSLLMSDSAIESYCQAGLKQAEDEISAIEDAVKRYRAGSKQDFEE